MDRFIIVMDRERMKRVDYLVVFPIDLDSEAEKRRRRVKGVPCDGRGGIQSFIHLETRSLFQEHNCNHLRFCALGTVLAEIE